MVLSGVKVIKKAIPQGPHQVCIIGSGNWGTTVAKLVAENATDKPERFLPKIRMWVFEEQVEFRGRSRKLSEVINETRENVKYLPGIRLPRNIEAVPDLKTAVTDAHILIFVLPHQFLKSLLPDIKSVMREDAVTVSLIKGIEFENGQVNLVSDRIREQLKCEVSVLMGANLAEDIANEEFAEATIGGSVEHADVLVPLFRRPYFGIGSVRDGDAVELLGALKNIIALGAGFCDGLKLGNNTKAAILRIGMIEMSRMISWLTKRDFDARILLESCGAADLITTCYGGRNRKCAKAFIETRKSWDQIEKELLKGQKLQGTLTCEEIHRAMQAAKIEDSFPLTNNIYRIAFQHADPLVLFENLTSENSSGAAVNARI